MARILLITSIFPPVIGGPATFIDHLAGQLQAAGHSVTVLCASEGPAPEVDSARAFRIIRVDLKSRYVYEVLVRLALFWQLLWHKVVLVNGLDFYVAPIARLLRRRYVLKVVGDSVWEQGRNWGLLTDRFDDFQQQRQLPRLLQGLAAKRQALLAQATHIITPGAYLAKVVEAWPGAAGKVQVIANGAQLDAFAGAKPAPRAGALKVLFYGRFTNWKGLETLLLAVAGLEGLELTLVGDGPELPMLTELVTQLSLGNKVALHGKMKHEQLLPFMQQCHVYVLPSNYEGLSHSLLEAGAAGLARVVSDIGGNAELVRHGENGLVFPYGDVAALRAALLRLCDDDALRQQLGAAAQESAKHFNFSATVKAYAAVLEAL